MRDFGQYLDDLQEKGAPYVWAQNQRERLFGVINDLELSSNQGQIDLARISARLIASLTTYTEGLWENVLFVRRDIETVHRAAVKRDQLRRATLIVQTALLALILWRVW